MDSSMLTPGDPTAVTLLYDVRIPMRDGIELSATLYLPKAQASPSPAVFTLTPYLADTFHSAGVFFATHGFPFLVVDCRGRGGSGGKFRPNQTDGVDGHDIVAWVAGQPWCNGKVAMGGGSYSGWNQWATAGTRPPSLASIMPRCAACPGVDFPARNNIIDQYAFQWLTYVAGRTLQQNLFSDHLFWAELWKQRFVAGKSYASLPYELGRADGHLLRWIAHPEQDAFWDSCVPSPSDYAGMTHPVLSVTGAYDDNQYGTFAYHRLAMAQGTEAFRDGLYLVIGPWDHHGVGAPQLRVGGVEFGPASLIDFRSLSVEWYRWTMADGPRPGFLKDKVAWYVAGRDLWRYAPTLEAVTARMVPLHLASGGGENRLATPGRLAAAPADCAGTDSYVYDPRDTSIAELEASLPFLDPADMRMVEAQDGKQLVYETAPFEADTEISGFFRLDAWMSIDRPDTDFRVLVQLVAPDGTCILLANDTMRARHREGLRAAALIETAEPLLYRFEGFGFISRLARIGDRLRLVIGPYNSIYIQRNYNGGGVVSDESLADARPVAVTLWSGGPHQSLLWLPVGAGDRAS
jgi:putative CocE/NonD family hydrolase